MKRKKFLEIKANLTMRIDNLLEKRKPRKFIKIENIPSLMNFLGFLFSNKLSILIVKFALISKNFFLFIDNQTILILDELVPSRISWVCISIGTSEVHGSLLVIMERFNGL
jgi:hypothetical protein